jgi:transcriptional regulator with XRE-family HTH domain
MSTGKAIRDLIEARGLRQADVARGPNRVTLYRVLSGETPDPHVSTLIRVCDALGTGPGELLELAGLTPRRERSAAPLDAELRRMFDELQGLGEDDKRLCLAMLRRVIEIRARRHEGRPRRRAARRAHAR